MPTNTPLPTVSTGNVIAAATTNDTAALNTCVGLFAVGTGLIGSPPSANAPNWQIQAASTVTSASSGFFTVTFPTAFPNGLLTVIICNGDNNVFSGWAEFNAGASTASQFSGRLYNGSSGPTSSVRINYLAIGF